MLKNEKELLVFIEKARLVKDNYEVSINWMTKKKSSRTQKISWSGTKKEPSSFKSIPKQKSCWISWKWFVTHTAELHRSKLVLKILSIHGKYYSYRDLFTENYVKVLRRLRCSKGRGRVTHPGDPSKHYRNC